MDKELLRFINREINYVETMCGIGREPAGQGKDYMMISPTQLKTDEPMWDFWNTNKKKKKPVSGKRTETNSETELMTKPRSKKTYYAKLYVSEIKKYPKDKLSYEYAGMCLHLAAFIEWESGFLVVGRGKRKRYMQRQDIAKALEISDSTARRLITKLEELKLLKRDEKGYKMTGRLFGKGREVQCESNLKQE